MTEKKTTVARPANDFVRLQDLWGMFLPKWHWFALSLLVALAVAAFYLLSTPPVYTRTASVLIKDDSKSGGSTTEMSNTFADMGIFKSNTNINNELLTLQSPTLMGEVVIRLGLNETYTVRRGLKDVELYRSSPVSVTFGAKGDVDVAFTITPVSAETFTLTDFLVGGEDAAGPSGGKMGDTLRTVAGPVVIAATPTLTAEFVGKSIYYSRGSVQGATDLYTSRLRAELGNQDATIINLSVSDPSTRKAEDILNTLIAVYNENWIRDKNQIAISTSQFIDGRLGVIENDLGHVDENISDYKSKNLLPDVHAASSLYMSQSAENQKELLTLGTQLSTARYIRQELNGKSLDQPLPTNSGIDNGNIESQIGEYNAMVLNRNKLIANSSERNPLVIDLANSLQSMQNTIIQSVDNLIVALNTQISSIRRQEVTTTGQLAASPNKAKYLLSVERQQKVKEELYLYLLQKREENELSQAFTAYNTRVITAPRGSATPTAPRKMNILMVAFVIGLLAPAVVIFVLESTNTKVRGRKDLESLSLPFLGEIPLVTDARLKDAKKSGGSKRRPNERVVVVKAENRDVVNDAFRVVRTNLEFMSDKDKPYKVVMLTSLNQGSGKTFMSLNLSASFAIKKKRVILIDLDLRRATLSKQVRSPREGISNYLAGQVADWRSIVSPGDTPADDTSNNDILPDIIPVGSLPPNPTELLFSPRLEELLSTLRGEYDYIFIDCPPVEMVADTSIIARWVDLTLFVVRAGLLERELLPTIDGYYADRKFNNLALLLNGTSSMYGRKYGYHYHYGYHYGEG
ncbi:MAG: polysaccharide biosynthesis tyrosine autokinase [Mediterranea sp.]|jgi:capsular exopolysaccharide synthesis family protein|nr:polysaccharide biosynthesis tyrosine autokinase [Mediterranea sp.]